MQSGNNDAALYLHWSNDRTCCLEDELKKKRADKEFSIDEQTKSVDGVTC